MRGRLAKHLRALVRSYGVSKNAEEQRQLYKDVKRAILKGKRRHGYNAFSNT